MDNNAQRILVVDDRPEEVSAVLKFCASSKWPNVEIENHKPTSDHGRIDWDKFDLLVVGVDAGMKHRGGLAWLKAAREKARLPAAIVMADVINAQLRQDAADAGAQAVIDKLELSPMKFGETINAIGLGTHGSGAALQDGELEQTRPNPNEVGDRSEPGVYSTADASDPTIDIEIPGYRLIKRMKGSGIAQIFVAEQLGGDNNIVVLKVLELHSSIGDTTLKRFMREYKYIELIDHPSVINVFDTGQTRDHAYIAMEFCPHGTLVDRIELGLDTEDAIGFVRQIAAGLGAVHLQGISHRDVKPANCLLRTPKRAVLADFGIAKNELTLQALTDESDFFGTLFYTSPEQLKGAEGDPRGDLYSLGIMMYQMLSGSLPYASKGLRSLINAHINEPLAPLPEHLSRYQAVVDGLTQKDPEKRTQSTKDLLAQLDALDQV